MVEFEQAAEAFAGVDLAGCAANPVCCCWEEEHVALTLVVPLGPNDLGDFRQRFPAKTLPDLGQTDSLRVREPQPPLELGS